MPTPVRIEPGVSQESVWDYPRPPRIESVPERIAVVVDGQLLAQTTRALRVLETADTWVGDEFATPSRARSTVAG